MRSLLLFVLPALISAMSAQGQNVGPLAGQAFELGAGGQPFKVSEEDARRDYERTLLFIKAAGAGVGSVPCKVLLDPSVIPHGDDTDRCTPGFKNLVPLRLGAFASFAYLPPFPASLPGRIRRAWLGGPVWPEPWFAWAPLSTVRNGAQVLKNWEDLARRGTLLDCVGNECTAVVRTFVEDLNSLAECKVISQDGISGPPSDCEPIALLTSKTTWIEVLAGFHKVLHHPPIWIPRLSLRIKGNPLPDAKAIMNSVGDALASPPLKLRTETSTLNDVKSGVQTPWGFGGMFGSVLDASSQAMPSQILGKGRECLWVRVIPGWASGGRLMVLEITITAFVSLQNTDRPEDWHLPSTMQLEAYRKAVLSALKERLVSLCVRPAWEDDFTLQCGSSQKAKPSNLDSR